MFGVVDDKLPVIFQVSHGVTDHRQIFTGRAAQNLLHMQERSLAVNRHHGRGRFDEQAHLIVLLDRRGLLPRRAEGRKLGVLKFFRLAWAKNSMSFGLLPGQPPSM